MSRSARITIVLATAAVVVLSTTFALVRSAQLASSRAEVAELRAELDNTNPGADATEPPSSGSADDDAAGDEGSGDAGSGDDPNAALEDLFGDDIGQLAQCVGQAGAPGSADVGDMRVGEQIAEISDVVEQLRSLRFDRQPEPVFLDDQRIAARLEREIRQEYDEASADEDQRLLAALGAVPRSTDLIDLQTDLLTSQVAGFYDPDTGELVVRGDSGDEGLSPLVQSTLAHELQHALADQALDLPVDVTEDVADGDAALAALALVEGDATVTQQRFSIVGMSLVEQLQLGTDPTAAEAQEQLADVPHYLAQSLQFPYVEGLRFVCSQLIDGDWAAVDALYDALPTTSAEIMEPQRYPTAAVDPADPGSLGGSWERRRTTTMGAADLLWLFEAPGGDTGRALDEPRESALAWTGGELQLWTDGADTAVGIALTQRQGGPLCDAVATWYERAFPDSTDAPSRRDERLIRESDDQTAVVACSGADVRMGIAPDLATARALVR